MSLCGLRHLPSIANTISERSAFYRGEDYFVAHYVVTESVRSFFNIWSILFVVNFMTFSAAQQRALCIGWPFWAGQSDHCLYFIIHPEWPSRTTWNSYSIFETFYLWFLYIWAIFTFSCQSLLRRSSLFCWVISCWWFCRDSQVLACSVRHWLNVEVGVTKITKKAHRSLLWTVSKEGVHSMTARWCYASLRKKLDAFAIMIGKGIPGKMSMIPWADIDGYFCSNGV